MTLFDGFTITRETELCEKYVIQEEAARIYSQMGKKLNGFERDSFVKLMNRTASQAELQDSLKLFSKVLYYVHGM